MPHMRRIAVRLAAVAVLLGAGAVLFAWSGIYNVAASRGHFELTSWFLETVMRSSVRTHSLPVDAPPLDDPNQIRLGASVYLGNCALCHGGPGQPSNPLAQHMLPPPPDLAEAVRKWDPEELFWIVKHGLKYTGMPAWSAQNRDDEIWTVVAFLGELPDMPAGTYQELARGRARTQPEDGAAIAHRGTGLTSIAVCARCHGDGTAPPSSRLAPKLAGLPAAYLELALNEYANASRPSGIMQPVAGELDAAAIRQISAYYAALPSSRDPAAEAQPERVARGRKIAEEGVPANSVPSCMSCHAGGALATYPPLAGQNAPYTAAQLRLWQAGGRSATPQGEIMTPIARGLTPEQIEDVSAYFESLQPGDVADAAPKPDPRSARP